MTSEARAPTELSARASASANGDACSTSVRTIGVLRPSVVAPSLRASGARSDGSGPRASTST